ncbi:LytTR family transcriptional regulator DNA-binding domain-containing protein [Bizionia arctica]|uniref:LytTR family transcriptional regulator DNA-binding domain-containing protein n=1 Tax=Bizionia arctica TaxID=1495645 RepID=UPI0016649F04
MNINIFTSNNEEHLARRSISEFLDLYPTEFIRIHKSVLINKNSIQSYSSLSVKVNSKKLPLGRAYKQNFLDQIKDLSFS